MGPVLVIEFAEQDESVFGEIMRALERHPGFELMHLNNETMLSLPRLKIYPERRKVYCNCRQIELATK